MQPRSSLDQQPLATYGLASQLRTPPQDLSSTISFTSPFQNPVVNSKKVTPAMRDEQRTSPIASQGWTARSGSQAKRDGKRDGIRPGGEMIGRSKSQPGSRKSPSSRQTSSHEKTENRPSNTSWTPSRPRRPSSPSLESLPPPVPSTTPYSQSGSNYSKSVGDFSFAPLRPLDLGIRLDPGFSTYHSSMSSPSLLGPGSPEEAQVGVATRVSRGSLNNSGGRKASIVAIPAGQSAPLASPSAGDDSRALRRASASRRKESQAESDSQSPSMIARQGYFQQSAPAPSRLPANLLSLARRTAHIAQVPGYGWRLHLLEKLEIIMGAYLSIQEAEDILSIGNGAEAKTTQRLQSRRSQIDLPPPSPRVRQNSKPAGKSSGGFFSKARTFFGSHNESTSTSHKETTSTAKQPASKVVFGQPLSVVSEYGFVTSMIAGQRHDLPGVCFSTVEEIYRRGQGPKIPGLLHLSGEPTRIAKLVNIYNQSPDYGEHHDLSIESIHNVTSLLKKYLRDLPEPILDQRVWRLYNAACVDSNGTVKQQVASAQIILRLLPAPNFSLMVYLIAFLSQMPLFPENSLSLESVSAIFGTAAMAIRPPAQGAAKLTKSGEKSMVISSPNEQAASTTSKKAQEGLLWLLNHWSAVADGLLEPDFDVDTNAILDQSPANFDLPVVKPQPSVPIPAPEEELSLDPPPPAPQSFEVLADEKRPTSPSTVPKRTSVSSSSHRSSYTPASPLNLSHIAPSQSPVASPIRDSFQMNQNGGIPFSPVKDSFTFNHDRSSLQSPTFNVERSTMQSPTKDLFALDPHTLPMQSMEEAFPVVGETPVDEVASPALDVPDMPAFASPRDSMSTLESSSLSSRENKTQAIPLLDDSGKGNGGQGIPRAIPEDEFGPLGPPGTSVLDDLLEPDQDGEPSVYNFPTPPTDSGFVPSITASKVNRDSLLSNRDDASDHRETLQSNRNSRSDSLTFLRNKGEQLQEAQRIQEDQRLQIQALWKQITDNELARSSERSEVECLRQEVASLKATMVDRSKELMAITELQERWRESEAALEAARESLEVANNQLAAVKEEKERGEREANDKIAALLTQLDTIRSVLGGDRL